MKWVVHALRGFFGELPVERWLGRHVWSEIDVHVPVLFYCLSHRSWNRFAKSVRRFNVFTLILWFINSWLGFGYSRFEKGEIAWKNCIKTLYEIYSFCMSISAILVSPKLEAFAWSYRSSIYIRAAPDWSIYRSFFPQSILLNSNRKIGSSINTTQRHAEMI